MIQSVRDFYDAFSQRQLRDYTDGNRRVDRQFLLLRAGIPPDARNVLVVGCGIGEIAKFLISSVVRDARVVGIDISKRAIEMANLLFPHERIVFQHADILEHDFGRLQYDVVVLPDVYEHIPISGRPALHRRLSELLTGDGRILVTIPSPAHQRQVRLTGDDRQIVDEIVTPEDLTRLASDIDGQMTYFAIISVWAKDDYAHAVIERNPSAMGPFSRRGGLALKLGGRSGLRHVFYQGWRHLFVRPFRRRRVRRRLQGSGQDDSEALQP